MEVAQEASQRGDEQLRARTAQAPGLAHDEVADIAHAQRLERHGPRGKTFREKSVDDGQTVLHRRPTHTALVDEEALIAAFDRCERIRALQGRRGERNPPARAQMAQQLPGGRCFAASHASRSASQQKRFDTRFVERFDTQALVLKPATEIADEPKLAHRRGAGVSLGLEARGEPVEITGQWTDTQPSLAGSAGEIELRRHRSSPSRWRRCQQEKTTGLFRNINHRDPTQRAEATPIPGIHARADPE